MKREIKKQRLQPVRTHVDQENTETKLLQLQEKMKLILEALQMPGKSKEQIQQLKQQEGQLNLQLQQFEHRYGINYFDILSKLHAEKLKSDVIDARKKEKERLANGEDEDLFDLVDENQILIHRSEKGKKIPDAFKPALEQIKRRNQGLPAGELNEADYLAMQKQMKLPEAYGDYNPRKFYKIPVKNTNKIYLPYEEHFENQRHIKQQEELYQAQSDERKKIQEEVHHMLGIRQKAKEGYKDIQNSIQQKQQRKREEQQRKREEEQIQRQQNKLTDKEIQEQTEQAAKERYQRQQQIDKERYQRQQQLKNIQIERSKKHKEKQKTQKEQQIAKDNTPQPEEDSETERIQQKKKQKIEKQKEREREIAQKQEEEDKKSNKPENDTISSYIKTSIHMGEELKQNEKLSQSDIQGLKNKLTTIEKQLTKKQLKYIKQQLLNAKTVKGTTIVTNIKNILQGDNPQ